MILQIIIRNFICTQGLIKYMFVDDINSLVEISKFIKDIYEKDTKSHSRFYYSILCQTYAKRTEIILKALAIGYIALHICYISVLFLHTVLNGKMVPMLRIYLPGIDTHSIGGAIFLNVLDYVSITTGYVNICCFDLLIFTIFINMPMLSLVIIGHLDELREPLLDKKDKKDKKCKFYEIKKRLIQIVAMHNKLQ